MSREKKHSQKLDANFVFLAFFQVLNESIHDHKELNRELRKFPTAEYLSKEGSPPYKFFAEFLRDFSAKEEIKHRYAALGNFFSTITPDINTLNTWDEWQMFITVSKILFASIAAPGKEELNFVNVAHALHEFMNFTTKISTLFPKEEEKILEKERLENVITKSSTWMNHIYLPVMNAATAAEVVFSEKSPDGAATPGAESTSQKSLSAQTFIYHLIIKQTSPLQKKFTKEIEELIGFFVDPKKNFPELRRYIALCHFIQKELPTITKIDATNLPDETSIEEEELRCPFTEKLLMVQNHLFLLALEGTKIKTLNNIKERIEASLTILEKNPHFKDKTYPWRSSLAKKAATEALTIQIIRKNIQTLYDSAAVEMPRREEERKAEKKAAKQTEKNSAAVEKAVKAEEATKQAAIDEAERLAAEKKRKAESEQEASRLKEEKDRQKQANEDARRLEEEPQEAIKAARHSQKPFQPKSTTDSKTTISRRGRATWAEKGKAPKTPANTITNPNQQVPGEGDFPPLFSRVSPVISAAASAKEATIAPTPQLAKGTAAKMLRTVRPTETGVALAPHIPTASDTEAEEIIFGSQLTLPEIPSRATERETTSTTSLNSESSPPLSASPAAPAVAATQQDASQDIAIFLQSIQQQIYQQQQVIVHLIQKLASTKSAVTTPYPNYVSPTPNTPTHPQPHNGMTYNPFNCCWEIYDDKCNFWLIYNPRSKHWFIYDPQTEISLIYNKDTNSWTNISNLGHSSHSQNPNDPQPLTEKNLFNPETGKFDPVSHRLETNRKRDKERNGKGKEKATETPQALAPAPATTPPHLDENGAGKAPESEQAAPQAETVATPAPAVASADSTSPAPLPAAKAEHPHNPRYKIVNAHPTVIEQQRETKKPVQPQATLLPTEDEQPQTALELATAAEANPIKDSPRK